MIIALIDNGSLEPAAHRALRALAHEITSRVGLPVHAVSWKHSDRIPPAALEHLPAATLAPWLRSQYAAGEREFVFIPFFVSAQGAIGSYLRSDLERLQQEIGAFRFTFTTGLAARDALVGLVVDRIRELIRQRALQRPPVIVVDHGGPSPASAQLRNEIAAAVQRALGDEISRLTAASFEGGAHAHNFPLFADALTTAGYRDGDVVIAPLFLAPGRHAGPEGDLAQIATAAEDRVTGAPLRCHFIASLGTHPHVADVLVVALHETLSQIHVTA